MKRFLIAALMLGFAFAAQAQSSGSVVVKDEADQPIAQMEAAAATDQDKSSDRNCLRQTGSLITTRYNARAEREKQKCASVNGRAYTREDIQSTGTVDIGEALRRLDPAVR